MKTPGMSQISLACTAGGSCVYKTEEVDLNAALKLIEILVQVVHREVQLGEVVQVLLLKNGEISKNDH